MIHLKLLLRPDTLKRIREAEAGEGVAGLPDIEEPTVKLPMARSLIVVDAAIVLLCAAVAIAGVDQVMHRLD